MEIIGWCRLGKDSLSEEAANCLALQLSRGMEETSWQCQITHYKNLEIGSSGIQGRMEMKKKLGEGVAVVASPHAMHMQI